MTIEDQTKYLGFEKLNALDKINVVLNGQFQITGSLSLFEFGIIKRKINDIDIVVRSLDTIKTYFNKKEYELKEWFDYSDKLEDPKKTLQEKGKVTNRVSFKIDGVKICAFFAENLEFEKREFMNERFFRVTHPKYAIKAKKKHINNILKGKYMSKYQREQLKKHVSDITDFYSINTESSTSNSKLPF